MTIRSGTMTLSTPRLSSVIQHLNPASMAHNLWRHRDLILQFTQRDVEVRYKGSFLGLFWSLVNPLVMLLIYTFVFRVVLKARWQGSRSDSLSEFALVLFCGLTAFNIFSECVTRAPGLIVNVPNYVKKVVFPLEILPVSVLGSALFHALASLAVLLMGNLLVSGTIHWTLVLLPVVLLPLVFLCLGLSWLLAGLGVFIRDANYTVLLGVQVLMFLSPIFYSIDLIPEPFRTIIRFNPLTSIVENFRWVILWGKLPNWTNLSAWVLMTVGLMLLGYAWFVKTKKAFADVI
jgi:lipopolysaccharide transport system permease protein